MKPTIKQIFDILELKDSVRGIIIKIENEEKFKNIIKFFKKYDITFYPKDDGITDNFLIETEDMILQQYKYQNLENGILIKKNINHLLLFRNTKFFDIDKFSNYITVDSDRFIYKIKLWGKITETNSG